MMNFNVSIATGNTASIYLQDHKVYKVFNPYLPEDEAVREARKQRYAYERGIKVPKVLEVTIIDGRQVIVMEYIKEKTLGVLAFNDLTNIAEYLKTSIHAQQEIHRCEHALIEPMTAKLYRQIESANLLTHTQKNTLIKRLDDMPSGDRLCHGDFHLYNAIQSNGETIILDWVDASAGSPAADVYRSYLLYGQVSQEIAALYLEMYCKSADMNHDEITSWAPIIAGARLSENVQSEDPERLLDIVKKYC